MNKYNYYLSLKALISKVPLINEETYPALPNRLRVEI